jgi:hypothetical protein
MNSYKFLSLFFLLPSILRAAACCGSGSLLPSLITGDDRAQISAVLSYEKVKSDVFPDGRVFLRDSDDIETTQTLKLHGAYLFYDRLQAGIEVPLIKHIRTLNVQEESAVGLGDVTLDAGYEWLPERVYSSWQPKGFGFVKVLLPTGKSIYESETPLNSDILGKGFYQLAVGNLFIKTWGMWDAFLAAEWHWILPRSFQTSGAGTLSFNSGWGSSAQFGAGFNPSIFRIGISLSPSYESAQITSGRIASAGASKWVWNASAHLGVRWDSEWSSSVTYTDQTLLGGASNNTLSRSVSLLMQKRFEL